MKIEVTNDIDMGLWAKNADLISLINLRDICQMEIKRIKKRNEKVKCPKCGGEMTNEKRYLYQCLKCGYIDD